MKNQILNFGKPLNKTEQKQINGGLSRGCTQDGVMCCESTSWGNLCAPGSCDRFGCIWY